MQYAYIEFYTLIGVISLLLERENAHDFHDAMGWISGAFSTPDEFSSKTMIMIANVNGFISDLLTSHSF